MTCISMSYAQSFLNMASLFLSILIHLACPVLFYNLIPGPCCYSGPLHQNFSKTIILTVNPILTVHFCSSTQDKNLPRSTSFPVHGPRISNLLCCLPSSYNFMSSIFLVGDGGGGLFINTSPLEIHKHASP